MSGHVGREELLREKKSLKPDLSFTPSSCHCKAEVNAVYESLNSSNFVEFRLLCSLLHKLTDLKSFHRILDVWTETWFILTHCEMFGTCGLCLHGTKWKMFYNLLGCMRDVGNISSHILHKVASCHWRAFQRNKKKCEMGEVKKNPCVKRHTKSQLKSKFTGDSINNSTLSLKVIIPNKIQINGADSGSPGANLCPPKRAHFTQNCAQGWTPGSQSWHSGFTATRKRGEKTYRAFFSLLNLDAVHVLKKNGSN